MPAPPNCGASQNILKRCDRLFRELHATLSWLWFAPCTVLMDVALSGSQARESESASVLMFDEESSSNYPRISRVSTSTMVSKTQAHRGIYDTASMTRAFPAPPFAAAGAASEVLDEP